MGKQQDIIRNSLERIEEMYADNNNLKELYQQTLQKYIFIDLQYKKLLEKYNKVNDLLIKYNFSDLDILENFICKYSCTYNNNFVKEVNNNKNMVEEHLHNININKPITLYQPLEIDKQDNNYVSFKETINTPHSSDDEKMISNIEINKNTKEKKDDLSFEPSNFEIDRSVLITDDQFLEKYPIYIFPKTDNKCYKHAAGELFNRIKYSYELKNMIDNDDQTSFDDVSEYINDGEKVIYSDNNKYNIKKKIERSKYLYDEYGDKLKNVKFNTGKIFRLGKDNWKRWLLLLDKKLNLVTDDQNIFHNSNKKKDHIVLFNYNYILKNKKSQLFEENNKLYTYNFYEEKREADIPDGNCCNKCGYTRFTTSGCCIFRNCENRKYGNTEFKIYEDKNKKRCPSKYNKKEYISEEEEDEELDEDIFH
jgi:hypothetical protein